MPRLFMKMNYSVSSAVHSRIVRVRSVTDRKLRTTTKIREVSKFKPRQLTT